MCMRLALRYRGHRPGASLAYFAGAVDLIAGTLFAIPPEGMVLGRRASATLRVASSVVAPAHVRLTPTDQGILLEDHGSTNGTWANGSQITRTVLKAGDR